MTTYYNVTLRTKRGPETDEDGTFLDFLNGETALVPADAIVSVTESFPPEPAVSSFVLRDTRGTCHGFTRRGTRWEQGDGSQYTWDELHEYFSNVTIYALGEELDF